MDGTPCFVKECRRPIGAMSSTIPFAGGSSKFSSSDTSHVTPLRILLWSSVPLIFTPYRDPHTFSEGTIGAYISEKVSLLTFSKGMWACIGNKQNTIYIYTQYIHNIFFLSCSVVSQQFHHKIPMSTSSHGRPPFDTRRRAECIPNTRCGI